MTLCRDSMEKLTLWIQIWIPHLTQISRETTINTSLKDVCEAQTTVFPPVTFDSWIFRIRCGHSREKEKKGKREIRCHAIRIYSVECAILPFRRLYRWMLFKCRAMRSRKLTSNIKARDSRSPNLPCNSRVFISRVFKLDGISCSAIVFLRSRSGRRWNLPPRLNDF